MILVSIICCIRYYYGVMHFSIICYIIHYGVMHFLHSGLVLYLVGYFCILLMCSNYCIWLCDFAWVSPGLYFHTP